MKNKFLISCVAIPMILSTAFLTACTKSGGGDAPAAAPAPAPGNKPCSGGSCFPAQKPNPISDQQIQAFAKKIQTLELEMVAKLIYRQADESRQEHRETIRSLGRFSRDFYGRIFTCQFAAPGYQRTPIYPQSGQPFTETISSGILGAYNLSCPIANSLKISTNGTASIWNNTIDEDISGTFDYTSTINFQASALKSTRTNGNFHRVTSVSCDSFSFFGRCRSDGFTKTETFNEYGDLTFTNGVVNMAISQTANYDVRQDVSTIFTFNKSFRFNDNGLDVMIEVLQESVNSPRVYQINGVVYSSDQVHQWFQWLKLAERIPTPSSQQELDRI